MLLVDERCLQPDLVGADRIVPIASVAASRDLDASSSTQRAATKIAAATNFHRKVSHVVFAGLFPMVDRQRLTIVLAIETGPHAFYAARLARMVLREDDLQPVSPQHQNVSAFRAEETTKAQ